MKMKIIYVLFLLSLCIQSLAHNINDYDDESNVDKMRGESIEKMTQDGKNPEKSVDLYIFLFAITIAVFIILIILFLVTVLNICAGFIISYQWPHPRFLFWKESHSDRSSCICCCFPLYQMNFGLAIIWLIVLCLFLVLMSWIPAIISTLLFVLLIFSNLLLHKKYVEAGWPVNLANITSANENGTIVNARPVNTVTFLTAYIGSNNGEISKKENIASDMP